MDVTHVGKIKVHGGLSIRNQHYVRWSSHTAYATGIYNINMTSITMIEESKRQQGIENSQKLYHSANSQQHNLEPIIPTSESPSKQASKQTNRHTSKQNKIPTNLTLTHETKSVEFKFQ